ITFSNVTQAGNTTLVTSATGQSPPAGFSLGSPATYYNIATTARYSGSITICIKYAGISFPNATPQLFHYESGLWMNVTTSLDTPNSIVCGVVSSLSPFAVFGRLKLTPTITWNTPSPIVWGNALSSTQLNATASLPGAFTYTPQAGTVLPVGTQILSV